MGFSGVLEKNNTSLSCDWHKFTLRSSSAQSTNRNRAERFVAQAQYVFHGWVWLDAAVVHVLDACAVGADDLPVLLADEVAGREPNVRRERFDVQLQITTVMCCPYTYEPVTNFVNTVLIYRFLHDVFGRIRVARGNTPTLRISGHIS